MYNHVCLFLCRNVYIYAHFFICEDINKYLWMQIDTIRHRPSQAPKHSLVCLCVLVQNLLANCPSYFTRVNSCSQAQWRPTTRRPACDVLPSFVLEHEPRTGKPLSISNSSHFAMLWALARGARFGKNRRNARGVESATKTMTCRPCPRLPPRLRDAPSRLIRC